MNYELRPATNEDYTYCYLLTKRNMHDLFCRHLGGWKATEFIKGFILANIEIVIVKGRRAGYLSVKQDGASVYIDNIQISPLQQGRGMGTDMLNKLLAQHKEKPVLLSTFEDNPARNLYQRLGFVVMEKNGMTVKMARSPGHK